MRTYEDTVSLGGPKPQAGPSGMAPIALGEAMQPMQKPLTPTAKPKGAASPLQGGVLPLANPNGPVNPVQTPGAPPLPMNPAIAPAPVGGMVTHQASDFAPMPVGGPATSGLGPGAQGTPTNPNNPLTNQTISRAPTADRFKLAQDRFNTFSAATEPAYKSALRDANRLGAAQGRLGSGSLRTDFGNLANQRNLQLDTGRDTFNQNALEGSIDDSFRDVGIGVQQQGFQAGQQGQAFDQELRRLGFDDSMLNSAFGRALQTYMAGQSGGTGSGTGLQVGAGNVNAGGQSLEALMNLIRNQNAAPQSPASAPYNPAWRF